MSDAIWVDRGEQLVQLAQVLEPQESIGVDTEFLRERTFFPRLCLLQLSAGSRIWCVDTLKLGGLDALLPILTAPRARKIIHAARQDLEAEELAPSGEAQSDDEIAHYVRGHCTTLYHPSSTCRMGVDAKAVVDPSSMKVHGLEGLRIADASVIPRMISGNLQTPTIMIAERAAQMILAGS